jgi:FAD/FMN-containing dehydrogenase
MTSTMTLDDSLVRQFKSGVQGETLRPGDEGFDAARRVWNGMIDRQPALIVRCATRDDVVRAVGLARDKGLPLAVRGGGHNAAGLGVCDGGVVVDLRGMRGVRVDPGKRIARVQGGATWADLDEATAAHGLATTGGAVSSTGVAGLTLGGGIGWLMRSYGLAADNVISAEVVTADGRVVTASEKENPDLYWAIRGGGGNFGVVTEFEFRLHPVTTVMGGMLVHPAERAPQVLRFVRDFAKTAPDQLTMFCAMLTSPEGVRIIAIIVCYNGPESEGASVLRPLRAFGPPVADMVGPVPYAQHQKMLDEGFPSGLQVYWRGEFLRELTDECIDTMVARFNAITSPLSAIVVEQMGGAVARVADDATPFSYRSAPFNVAIVGRWVDPSERETHVAWTRGTSEAIRAFTNGGVYVNYLGVDEGADRVRAAYASEKLARLAEVKRKFDPSNLFRVNQNIAP